MPLLKLENFQLHYGEQVIFDNLDLQLEPGERLCLIGRNGVGKSTLIKCIAGEVTPDAGHRWTDGAVKIASLSQELPDADDLTVYQVIARGLADLGEALSEFEQLTRGGGTDLDRLQVVQARIEAADGWRFQNRIEQVITRLELDGTAVMRELSGGWRRRVALAQALVCDPDILLLDEPTNHLDVAAIRWLEEQLRQFSGALVFITHDRAFLRAVANKIGEMDRGQLYLWQGNYDAFLNYREERLATEEKHNALFDKRLAEEEKWIRQGIKARRTRNEGRVRALKAMREERAQRREMTGTANIATNTDSVSGKLVAELKDVSVSFDGRPIIRNFTGTILRGDKVGLIGPNGIGKSTLLRVILGNLTPDSGQVRLGTKLSVAYFDQLRDQLDLEKNAIDNIAGGRDTIEINGRSRHIISYLQDFLFSGERARTPIKSLSGGERNRILLAKLFSKPSNLLVMDEPTNDLDVETLELLEGLLMDYQGTLLLVSHDREFLDNVVTSSIAFEGGGKLREYVGGYSDWIRQGGHWPETGQSKPAVEPKAAPSAPAAKPAKAAKKLSYKLQLELDALPEELERLEQELETIHAEVGDPAFYSGDKEHIARRLAELNEKESRLEDRFARWEELEAMREGS